jgi:ribose transport system ATP-binding protein
MAAGIGFVPENRLAEAAFVDLSIAENISVAALSSVTVAGYVVPARERGNAKELIQRFAIKASSDKAPLSSLSGGNQQKVVLARWLQRGPRVLLLDEPTQGVDVGARAEIHELVRRAAADGAAVLVVSSEFKEIVDLCQRAVLVSHGRIVGPFEGELTEDNLTDTVYAQEASA